MVSASSDGPPRICRLPRFTQEPFTEELPRLLAERGMSLRALARQVEVSDSHLSKAIRGVGYKRVSGQLASKVAAALGLPEGYFVESREAEVVQRIRDDPELRDRLYKKLRKEAP
jgi:transcriptional regulator with XRE-family HTH domain